MAATQLASGLWVPEDIKANRIQQATVRSQPTLSGNQIASQYASFQAFLNAVKKVPWVGACASLVAYTFASNPFDLIDENGEALEDDEHPLIQLLARPNPWQSGFAFRELYNMQLNLTGNSYLLMQERDGYGRPRELYLPNPARMKVVPDPRDKVKGYVYDVSNMGIPGVRAIPFAADEVIHCKLPNPTDEYYGLGLIEMMAGLLDVVTAMSNHELGYWSSGGRIIGALQTDQVLGDEEFERVRREWLAANRDSKQRARVAILEKGLKYTPMAEGLRSLDITAIDKGKRDQILAIWGVPAQKLGIMENAQYKLDEGDRFFTCFVAGTPVTLRDRGEVPIEDIAVGDLLLTHEGRWQPVVATGSREYHGRLFTVGLAKHADPIEVSEEHPFYVDRDGSAQWVRVGDMVLGDMVLGRRLLTEELPAMTWAEATRSGHGLRLTHDVLMTPEIAWLCGLHVAEGHIVRTPDKRRIMRVDLAINAERADLIGAAAKTLAYFGAAHVGSPRRGTVIVSGGRAAADFLAAFGENAYGKRLPQWLLAAPEVILSAALSGYWAGDGHAGRYALTATTVSRRLMSDLRLALTRLGAVPCVRRHAAHQRVVNGAPLNAAEMWSVQLTGDEAIAARPHLGLPVLYLDPRGRFSRGGAKVSGAGFVGYRVEHLAVRQARGERIYNVEVAEDHSYTAAGVIAHNTETMVPQWERTQDDWQPLVELFDPELALQFERRNFEDDDAKIMQANQLVQGALITIDEGRKLLGLEPLPGGAGQMILLNAGLSPVKVEALPVLADQTITANETPPEQPSAAGDSSAMPESESTVIRLADHVPGMKALAEWESARRQAASLDVRRQRHRQQAWRSRDRKSVADRLRPPQRRLDEKAARPRQPLLASLRDRALADREASIARISEKGKPGLEAAFAYQRQIVGAAHFVEQLVGVSPEDLPQALAQLWPDVAPLAKAVGAFHAEGAQAGLRLARALIPGRSKKAAPDDEGGDDEARLLEDHPELRDRLGRRIGDIDQTTRDAVASQLEEGISRGYSPLQMAEGVVADDYRGIAGVWAAIKDYRAEAIARSETATAYNAAAQMGYRDAGVGRVGIIDGDEDEPCALRNGTEVSADVEVDLAHPNCTVAIYPVVAAGDRFDFDTELEGEGGQA